MNDDRPVSYTYISASASERTAGFPQRLARLVGDSSVRGFARRAGISDTFLRQCLAGRTEPTRTKLIALAAAGGCSVEWLATGHDSIRAVADFARDPAIPAERLDRSLLQAVVASVEEALAAGDRTVGPERKALLIAALYDSHVDQAGRSVSREEVQELLSRI